MIRCVHIGEIDDHQCRNFLFIKYFLNIKTDCESCENDQITFWIV